MATTMQLTPAQKKHAREASGRTDIVPGEEDYGNEGSNYNDAYDDGDVGTTDTSFGDDRDYYERFRDGDIQPASSSAPVTDTATQTEEKPDTSWITDEAKEFGASYNLGEEDIAAFGSMEELERFGQASDLAIRQRAPVAPEPKQEAQQAGSTDTTSTEETPKRRKPIDIEAMKAETEEPFDQFSIDLAESYNETQAEIAELRKWKAEQEQWRAEQSKEAEQAKVQTELLKFDKALDGLDKTLFGTAVKDGKHVDINPSFEANRRAVYESMLRIKGSLPEGQSIPESALIQRAVRATFGEVSRKVDPAKVEKQSRRRRPGRGANRGQNAGVQPARSEYSSHEDEVKAIANSPKIKALWNRMKRENGEE